MLDPKQIQASYDAVAVNYAALYFNELSRKPSDRALLNRFAASLRRTDDPPGLVYDVGCGPGQVGRYLHDEHGLRVCGYDISSEMVARARELNPPEMHFIQGSMLEIGVADEKLAGIVSFYAVIHVERELVPAVLREFYRVLEKDGTVLVAVHGGEGESRFENAFGVKVPFTATLFKADELRGYFENAGFEKVEVTEREPFDFEMQTKRIYVFATKR